MPLCARRRADRPGSVARYPSYRLAWFGSDCATTSGRGNHSTIATSGSGEVSGLRCVGSNVIAAGGVLSLAYKAPANGGAVRVQVFDLAGRRLAELPEGATVNGMRTTRWDGRDARGAAAARGIYFVQARGTVEAGSSVMVVVR
jgi:flagellar hook assembly protein FlgD